MPLSIIATPIGNPDDLTYRAHEVLKAADIVIGEERKELFRLLKYWKIEAPQTELLNEHSKPEDLNFFVQLCRDKKVALVTDAGTPAFCDPGSELVRLCRSKGIGVQSLPGPSSLMVFVSLLGRRLDQFLFLGFLPRDKDPREDALSRIHKSPYAVITMDTPYRLEKLLSELQELMPDRKAAVGMNLTMSEERWEFGTLTELLEKLKGQKAEFLIYIEELSSGGSLRAPASTSKKSPATSRPGERRPKSKFSGRPNPKFKRSRS